MCPSLSVVNADLAQSHTVSQASGTSQDKLCTYRGGGVAPSTVAIAIATLATFHAGEQVVANHGVAVVKVPGLGDEAWAVKAGGSLTWIRGDTQVQITSPGSTLAQLETLAVHMV
jgi:hypothetical protein